MKSLPVQPMAQEGKEFEHILTLQKALMRVQFAHISRLNECLDNISGAAQDLSEFDEAFKRMEELKLPVIDDLHRNCTMSENLNNLLEDICQRFNRLV